MDHLLAQDTYACGTIWSNRKDLPPCAKNKLKQGEKVSAQRGSLVFTKWHDKRDISFLSTNVLPSEAPRIVQRRKNGRNIDIEKPRVADVYTAHMGGVDRANQLRSFYFAGYSSQNGTGTFFGFYLTFHSRINLSCWPRKTEATDDQLQAWSGETTDQWFQPTKKETKISGNSTSSCGSWRTCLSSCSWKEGKMRSVHQSRATNTQRIQGRDTFWM